MRRGIGVQAAGVRTGSCPPSRAAAALGLAGKPGKAHPHARKGVTERGKNDRCTESTVRSVAAAREHGGPVHSAWSLPQGHGVRDGGGRKVFRVPGAAGLVRLGRRDLRDARRAGAHLRGLYAMGRGLSRGSSALRGLSGPLGQRLDVHRQGRRLRVSLVLGDRLLRARSPWRRRARLEEKSRRPGAQVLDPSGGGYGRLHIAGERGDAKGIFGRARHAAPLRPAQRPGAERPEVRVRSRPMRRVHGADRRQIRALLLGDGVGRRQGPDHHARGTGHTGEAAPAAAGFHRGAGLPVRLLQQRHDHGRQGAARRQSPPERTRDQGGLERPPVPLRLAQPHRSCRAARGKGDGMKPYLSRRDFLKTGSALVISFSLAPEAFGQAKPAPLPGSLNNNRMLNAWLRVNADGAVTIFTGKIELGQGIGTALTQIAADELDVDLKRINIVHGDTALTPNEGQTAGSQSVENSGTALRFACAEARDILLGAAAAKLGVAASALSVSDGTCTAPGGKSAAYWDLVADADFKREAQAIVKPKPASEHRWVGK